MTFDKFCENLCDKQPGLKDPDGSSVTISVASFQKQLRQAYKAGSVETKVLIGKAKALADKFEKVTGGSSPSFEELLNSLGRKFV